MLPSFVFVFLFCFDFSFFIELLGQAKYVIETEGWGGHKLLI